MSTQEPPAGQVPPPPGGYGQSPPPPPPAGVPYSAGTAWSYGWNKFTANFGHILVAVLVLVAIQIVVQVLSYLVSDALFLRWLFSLASWILSMIIGAGLVRAGLDITEGRPVEAGKILTPNKLGEVIVASLLTGIATFVGFIACILPGLAVLFFTSFTLYFLMDREEMGAIDAIKASFAFTKDNAANVIVWFLIAMVTWIVGALLCGIGLIAAVPVVLIGTAYTYKTLNGQPVAP